VTNISKHGFWILLRKRELFLPFDLFPWFANASVGHILNVELPSSQHLYWPDLDVDLSVESIERPENFPLVARVAESAATPERSPVSRRRKAGAASRKRPTRKV
jgi:hypothetical protein